MAEYISMNVSPSEARRIGQAMENLGMDYLQGTAAGIDGNGDRAANAEEVLASAFMGGDDQFCQAMRETYPVDRSTVIRNPDGLGQSMAAVGAAFCRLVDEIEAADEGSSDDVRSASDGLV